MSVVEEGVVVLKRKAGWLLAMASVLALTVAGCGGGSTGSESAPAPSETGATSEATTAQTETPSTLPPGASPGFDDLNQDGMPDPLCRTGDYGVGLILRVPCNAADYAAGAREGTTPVPGSLLELPALQQRELLSEASADAIQGRDPNGKLVVVFFIQADVLFDVGSATLSGPAQASIAGLGRAIQRTWPTATIQVRGHTDSTGSAAANQTLSEQRAANVAAYLATIGIERSRISSVGMSSSRPIVLEANPDGSVNPEGRAHNRRVELVVRVP